MKASIRLAGLFLFAFAAAPLARAEIIADSVASFSDVQGQDGWWFGYRNAADPSMVDYDPVADFTQFPEEWWDGGQWDFPGDVNPPWTELAADTTHPNGDNNGEVHWTIRRWEPGVATVTPAGISWHIHKANPDCGNGVTGSLHVNGTQLDTFTIASNDTTGVDRTFYVNLQPGDVVDLALQPLGTDGTNNDGCDGSVSSFIADDDIPDNPVQPDGTPFVPATGEDSDGDGIPDDWEMSYFPGDLTQLTADGDNDSDGLSDPDEFTGGLDPTDPDSDADGLEDGVETNTGVFVSADDTGTNPKRADTDGDGLTDGAELSLTPPSDPFETDTDGDGYGDGAEVARGFDPTNAADNPTVDEIANSLNQWSASGVQGENGWFYGYRNKTDDGGGELYDPDADFIQFPTGDPEDWWSGTQWDFPGGDVPWTEIGPENTHPNGNNNGDVHWTIRRWTPDVDECTPLALTWHMRKTNPAGNGVSGGVYLNGTALDFETIAGTDTVGVERTVFANINPGDVIDLALTPMGTDGSDNDGADGSANRLSVNTRIPAAPLQPDGSLFISCQDPDTDGDDLPDTWENTYFPGDLTQLSGDADYDSDGLTDRAEFDQQANPTVQDTDGDGLLDGVETGTGVFVDANDAGTKATVVDTDGDGVDDGDEVNGDPATNPVISDTDGDGYSDGVEIADGTDPTDAADNPGVYQIADSRIDWSSDGTQGANDFRYGYYNVPLEIAGDPTQADYDPVDDFTEFPQDWWDGGQWDFPGDVNPPWTEVGTQTTHPNGDNNGEVHWTIRRWVAEFEEITPIAITWHTSKQNLGCGNGVTGGIHVNGVRQDAVPINSNDGTGVTRTYYHNVGPGDVVDLINSPMGPNMSNEDGCDGSINWLLVDTRIPENPMQPDGTPFEPFVPSDPHLTVSNQTPFGELDVSPGVVVRNILVRNSGSTLNLDITGATLTGADASHYQVLTTFPLTLAPSEEGEIEVELDPMDEDGGFIAALDIASNDPDEPVKTVDLSAKIPNANRLLAHYRMNETDGTEMLDASGGGLHGMYVEAGGTVTLGEPGLAGGTAVAFDDAGGTASAYAEVPGLPVLEDFSVSLWFSQAAGDASSVLFSKGTDSAAPANPFALILVDGTVAWGVGGNVENPDVEVGGVVAADTVYHIVVTYEQGVSTAVFLDGVEVGRDDSPTAIDDSRRPAMQFGAMAGTLGYSGLMDDVQIYGKALTADDVAFLHDNPGEVLGGGDVEPGQDSDGDGQSDASEEIAGTDPNDASDYLRVLETQQTEDGVELSWSSKDGQEYDVLYSPDTTPGSWVVIATVTAAGDSTTYEDTDPVRTGAEEGYYRAQAK